MENICLEHGYDERYVKMAKAQDSIGWRRFMEGIVSKEMWNIQRTHASVLGMRHNTERWGVELVTHLLEVTHGQWLYRNVQVHDRITGLLEEDCYLAECNLGDLEETSGMKETYWLLAIKAAREAKRLERIRVSTAEQHKTKP